MSTAIGEKRLSTKRAERDVRQRARQSKAHPDCRSTTIKSCVTKISLALSSGRDNHPPAATAEMAILIVAVFPSRLTRYSPDIVVLREPLRQLLHDGAGCPQCIGASHDLADHEVVQKLTDILENMSRILERWSPTLKDSSRHFPYTATI